MKPYVQFIRLASDKKLAEQLSGDMEVVLGLIENLAHKDLRVARDCVMVCIYIFFIKLTKTTKEYPLICIFRSYFNPRFTFKSVYLLNYIEVTLISRSGMLVR